MSASTYTGGQEAYQVGHAVALDSGLTEYDPASAEAECAIYLRHTYQGRLSRPHREALRTDFLAGFASAFGPVTQEESTGELAARLALASALPDILSALAHSPHPLGPGVKMAMEHAKHVLTFYTSPNGVPSKKEEF